MRAKLDENLPLEVARLLRASGWECDTVHDLTLDLDFADIRTYPPGHFAGIVILRPAVPSVRQITRLVARVLPILASEWIDGRLWIVEPSRVRVRGDGEPGH